jgi:hypothetical protein
LSNSRSRSTVATTVGPGPAIRFATVGTVTTPNTVSPITAAVNKAGTSAPPMETSITNSSVSVAAEVSAENTLQRNDAEPNGTAVRTAFPATQYNGNDGACGNDNVAAAVMNSPESPGVTLGAAK